VCTSLISWSGALPFAAPDWRRRQTSVRGLMKGTLVSEFGGGETDTTLASLAKFRATLEELSAQIDGRPQVSTTVKRVKFPTNVRVDSLCCCGHVKTRHKQYRTRYFGHTYGWGCCAKCPCAKFDRTDRRPKAEPGA
jgi:hypothetical protein